MKHFHTLNELTSPFLCIEEFHLIEELAVMGREMVRLSWRYISNEMSTMPLQTQERTARTFSADSLLFTFTGGSSLSFLRFVLVLCFPQSVSSIFVTLQKVLRCLTVRTWWQCIAQSMLIPPVLTWCHYRRNWSKIFNELPFPLQTNNRRARQLNFPTKLGSKISVLIWFVLVLSSDAETGDGFALNCSSCVLFLSSFASGVWLHYLSSSSYFAFQF